MFLTLTFKEIKTTFLTSMNNSKISVVQNENCFSNYCNRGIENKAKK